MQDLTNYNTFGVHATANSIRAFHNLEELKHLIKISKNQNFMVLGGVAMYFYPKLFRGYFKECHEGHHGYRANGRTCVCEGRSR